MRRSSARRAQRDERLGLRNGRLGLRVECGDPLGVICALVRERAEVRDSLGLSWVKSETVCAAALVVAASVCSRLVRVRCR